MARRGADRQHRPTAAARDPRRAQARRGAAALLLPPALLDRPLRAVQRRRAGAVGRLRRGHPPGRLALRAAPRRPGRGLDDARAAGQRALRGLLRHRVPHVRAGHPPDRLRVPGPGPGRRRAPAGQPHRGRRRDGGAALFAVLVHLPGGHGRHLAARLRGAHPAARASASRRRGPRSIAVAVGVPALRALGADVRLPGQAHGDAVGGATQLLRRHQRPHRLHRQPGFHAADGHQPGPPAGRHLLRHAGAGRVRRRQVRAHHRARPAHPAPGPQPRLRGARARSSPPSPAGSSPPSAFSSRYAAVVFLPFVLLVALGTTTLLNPKVARRRGRAGRRGGAGLVGPERHHAADAGRRRGGGHQRAGQAGRRHRLLPRPAGPVRLPPDPEPVAVRHAHLPPPHRARRSSTGSTTPTRCTGPDPQRLRRRRGPARRAPPTTSGWSGSRCTRPSASSARRSPRTC